MRWNLYPIQSPRRDIVEQTALSHQNVIECSRRSCAHHGNLSGYPFSYGIQVDYWRGSTSPALCRVWIGSTWVVMWNSCSPSIINDPFWVLMVHIFQKSSTRSESCPSFSISVALRILHMQRVPTEASLLHYIAVFFIDLPKSSKSSPNFDSAVFWTVPGTL